MNPLPMLRERLHISVSQLKSFLKCSLRYQFAYVLGIEPELVPVALAFGTAIHAALAVVYRTIRDSGSHLSLEATLQAFRDAWAQATSSTVPLEDDVDHGAHVDRGAGMLKVFHQRLLTAPLPRVIAVEEAFAVELRDPVTGHPLEEGLVGAFDLVIEEAGLAVIVEHKTAARRWSEHDLRFDLQMTGYHLAAREVGFPGAQLRLQILRKTKTPAIQVEDVERDDHDVAEFLVIVRAVLGAIEAELFFPNRGPWCASCPYQRRCTQR